MNNKTPNQIGNNITSNAFGADDRIAVRKKTSETTGAFAPTIKHANRWLLTVDIVDNQMAMVSGSPTATLRREPEQTANRRFGAGEEIDFLGCRAFV